MIAETLLVIGDFEAFDLLAALAQHSGVEFSFVNFRVDLPYHLRALWAESVVSFAEGGVPHKSSQRNASVATLNRIRNSSHMSGAVMYHVLHSLLSMGDGKDDEAAG